MKQRDISIDVVKVFAALCVVGVHFFLKTGFYQTPVSGPKMYAAVTVRTFFMVCVPLFLLATGALMREKRLSARYYTGLLPVLYTYLAASAACLLFRVLYLKEEISPLGAVRMIFDFTGAPNGWYVEMYIGLFLMIPFLNEGWRALGDRRKKGALVVTLLALCAVPSLFNVWVKLLPDWFSATVYPVMYYFLGAFLFELPPKPQRGRAALAAAAVWLAACSAFNIAMTGGGLFGWADYTLWGGFETAVLSALVFVLLRSTAGWRPPAPLARLLEWLSGVTLGTYLISYIFDTLFYARFNPAVWPAPERLIYLPAAVLTVYCLSALCASALELVRRPLFRALGITGKGKNTAGG